MSKNNSKGKTSLKITGGVCSILLASGLLASCNSEIKDTNAVVTTEATSAVKMMDVTQPNLVNETESTEEVTEVDMESLKEAAKRRYETIKNAEDSYLKFLQTYNFDEDNIIKYNGKEYIAVTLAGNTEEYKALVEKDTYEEVIPYGVYTDFCVYYLESANGAEVIEVLAVTKKDHDSEEEKQGIYNLATGEEEVPCNYENIGSRVILGADGEKRYIVGNSEGYGVYSSTEHAEVIPCGTYLIVGFPFNYNGKVYFPVSKAGDYGKYIDGWLNADTLNEDIPCSTYDYISENTFIGPNGKEYHFISVPDDELYVYGWLNSETLEVDLPCKTYFFTGWAKSYSIEGKIEEDCSGVARKCDGQYLIRVWGNTPEIDGYYSLDAKSEVVPCGKYDKSDIQDDQNTGKQYIVFTDSKTSDKIVMNYEGIVKNEGEMLVNNQSEMKRARTKLS